MCLVTPSDYRSETKSMYTRILKVLLALWIGCWGGCAGLRGMGNKGVEKTT